MKSLLRYIQSIEQTSQKVTPIQKKPKLSQQKKRALWSLPIALYLLGSNLPLLLLFPQAARADRPGICAIPGKDGSPTINGIVNTYYPGTGANVAIGATSVPVGAINSSGNTTPIAKGDLILIIQMQDADINSTNTDAYGNGVGGDVPTNVATAPPPTGASGYTNLNNAGRYEYAVAAGPIVGGAVPIQNGTIYSYRTQAGTTTFGQRTYQVVRIPQYLDATITGTLTTAAQWNGSSGGIVALDVAKQLTFSPGSAVDVNGLGFRGGGSNPNPYSGSGSASPSPFRSVSTGSLQGADGPKGEGIAGTPRFVATQPFGTFNVRASNVTTDLTTSNYPNGDEGRGAPANAGGGGNEHNSGGGGGANGGNGGLGGRAFDGFGNTPPAFDGYVGGFGGTALPSNPQRLILGGGGGAGDTNDQTRPSGAGGGGGGLVIIRAGTVTGAGTILSRGADGIDSPAGSSPDAGGGGGAGGTVLIATQTGTASGVTVTATGGEGGGLNENNTRELDGPGAGGGGGAVYSVGASGIVTGGAPGLVVNNTTTRNNTSNGATAGQGGVTGSVSISTDLTTSISGSNPACLNEPPTTTDLSAPSQPNPSGTNTVPVPTLAGNDPEDGALGAGKSFRIVTLPTNGILYYLNASNVPVAVTAGQVITNYDPTKLKLDPNDGAITASFTYAAIDSASKEDPTPATVTMPFTAKPIVTKTTSTPNVAAGGSATYTIRVTNPGNDTLTNVSISDTLPSGFTYDSLIGTPTLQNSASRPTTVNPAFGSATPVFGNFTLPANASVSLTFTVDTPTNQAAGTYQNPAIVTYTDGTGTNTVNYDPSSSTAEDVAINAGVADPPLPPPAPIRSAAGVCAIPGKNGPLTGGGILNTYYPSLNTSIAAGSKSINLGSAVGSTTTIQPGDLLMVIQMQDATINATNTAAYGSGNTANDGRGQTSMGNSGVYEYVVATNAVSGSGGTLNFTGAASGGTGGLINSYSNANATGTQGQKRFQVVRVPQYSSLTLTSTVTALEWNGSVGGMVVIDVAGQLNFSGRTIDGVNRGFRGGFSQKTSSGNSTLDYVGTTSTAIGAGKGEGTAGTPQFVWNGTTAVDNGGQGYPSGDYGRGAPANAGGGGNFHNSGGGGGGNGGVGGKGAIPWEGAGGPVDSGGRGGAMSSLFAADPGRLFLGGGGGGGDANNATTGVRGGVGGGLVILRSGTMSGSGTINVTGDAGDVGAFGGSPDGAGGGGAGGSVLLAARNSSPLLNLSILANGGAGGNTLNDAGNEHGPGAGGGGGVILHSAPGASLTLNSLGGANGRAAGGTGIAHGATPGQNGQAALMTNDPFATVNDEGCLPKLTVLKSTTTPEIAQGGLATYKITVSNDPGRTTATGINIQDVLPTGFTYDSTIAINLGTGSTRTTPTSPTAGNTTANWGQFDIPSGDKVEISFKALSNGSIAPGTYQNPAAATYLDPKRAVATDTTTTSYDPASSTGEDVTVTAPIVSSVSGTVFDDGSGNRLKEAAETLVDGPALGLNAVLVDSTNKVVAIAPVSATGTYTFTGIAAGNYTVLITTNAATLNAAPPAVALPTNWVTTGENINNTVDPTADSRIPVTVGTTAITGLNFGIEQRPTAIGVTANSQSNPRGTLLVPVPPELFNTSTDPDGTVTQYRITAFPSNATSVEINGQAYTATTFPAAGVLIPASAIGTIKVDPNTDGVVSVTIPFKVIDNVGQESTNTANAVLPFGAGKIPELILLKRITKINGGTTGKTLSGAPIDLTAVVAQPDNPATPRNESGDATHPNWTPNYPKGALDAGQIKSGDLIEYTIYFMSIGGQPVTNANFCDWVPKNTTFNPNSYGVGAGIQLAIGSALKTFTNVPDSDRGVFYNPGSVLPATYPDGTTIKLNCMSPAGTDGAVVVNFVNNSLAAPEDQLPNATAPGTPGNSYGFIRFVSKVNSTLTAPEDQPPSAAAG